MRKDVADMELKSFQLHLQRNSLKKKFSLKIHVGNAAVCTYYVQPI